MDALTLKNAAALAASLGVAGMPAASQPLGLTLDCGVQFAKATPSIEGGRRVLYMEASNEARDVQNERILAAALEDSKDYFLKYGRLDLDHATVWQMIRETKLDPGNPYAREIGRPVDVRVTRRPGDIPRVFVKAEIFKSADPNNDFARAANWFWNTLEVTPPVVWYPSVAGHLLPNGRNEGPDGLRTISKLRWHSIGLSRNPVNTGVGEVSVVPLEVFAKALGGGTDITQALAVLSGYGTAPRPADADVALRAAGIKVPDTEGGSVAPGLPSSLTADKAMIIKQAILDAQPPFDLPNWLATLRGAGIEPAEGMAFLLAVLDGGQKLSLGLSPDSTAAL